MMQLAFVFVLIGFGTKAGFAPLHTWLADAHSQAPSPISGLLSGVLLACALYGLLRFHAITTAATGTDFSANLLLAFGILSVAVAAPFIIVQRDLKRLLAYSSVEHIGLMAIAFGIGGALGMYAGMLHLINHAATKALLFFTAGDIVQRYGTRRISAIRGTLRVTPLAGWLLLLGTFAIAGVPPSGIFVSELSIAWAAFAGNRVQLTAGIVMLLLLAVAFAGIVAHVLRIAHGTPSPAQEASVTRQPVRPDPTLIAPLVVLALVVLIFGIIVPEPVSRLIDDVAANLSPATQSAGR
jgi:hydrogenase-4 component F